MADLRPVTYSGCDSFLSNEPQIKIPICTADGLDSNFSRSLRLEGSDRI